MLLMIYQKDLASYQLSIDHSLMQDYHQRVSLLMETLIKSSIYVQYGHQ